MKVFEVRLSDFNFNLLIYTTIVISLINIIPRCLRNSILNKHMRRTCILQRSANCPGACVQSLCKISNDTVRLVDYLWNNYFVLSNALYQRKFLCLSCKQFSEHRNCLFFQSQNRTRRERIDIDLRSESLTASMRRCQDANTVTTYGLSKSFWTFTIKFSFSFQYFKIFFNINSVLLLLRVDWIWVSLLPTGPTWCFMKRECIPDEAINSVIKRDRVEVSLFILFCRFHFLC